MNDDKKPRIGQVEGKLIDMSSEIGGIEAKIEELVSRLDSVKIPETPMSGPGVGVNEMAKIVEEGGFALWLMILKTSTFVFVRPV